MEEKWQKEVEEILSDRVRDDEFSQHPQTAHEVLIAARRGELPPLPAACAAIVLGIVVGAWYPPLFYS